MASKNSHADTVECGLGRGELLQNFDAESRLLDHSTDAPDLPFDTVQAHDERLLLHSVQHVQEYATLEMGV